MWFIAGRSIVNYWVPQTSLPVGLNVDGPASHSKLVRSAAFLVEVSRSRETTDSTL